MSKKQKQIVVEPEWVEVKSLDRRIQDGEFENKTPYYRYEETERLAELKAEIERLKGEIETEKERIKDEVRQKNQAYRDADNECFDRFKAACFEDLGIKDNPKREKLWEKAWDEGHSSGFYDVWNHMQNLVELIEESK